MIVEIDYNNDKVYISNTVSGERMMAFSFHRNIMEVKLLLEELFNTLEPSGVELTLVNEDHRTTLGEW